LIMSSIDAATEIPLRFHIFHLRIMINSWASCICVRVVLWLRVPCATRAVPSRG
jgi:hypothetical protein